MPYFKGFDRIFIWVKMIRYTLYIVLKIIHVITIIQDMNSIQYLGICIGQWRPC